MDDETGIPQPLKLALILAWAGVLLAGTILLIDLQTKRAIVSTALDYKREATRGQDHQPPARRIPHPVHPVPPVDGGADGAGAPEAGVEAAAPAIVQPGDESARPPRRGGVDGGGA